MVSSNKYVSRCDPTPDSAPGVQTQDAMARRCKTFCVTLQSEEKSFQTLHRGTKRSALVAYIQLQHQVQTHTTKAERLQMYF